MNTSAFSNRLLRKTQRLLVFPLLVLLGSGSSLRAETHEIDLLVIYTPAVFSNYGSVAGITAHAAASVESVNAAMENSNIPVFFNLVGVEPVDYVESATSMGDDLEYITGEDDAFINESLRAEVHGLRDAYGADIVSLFRDGAVGGVAGIAWMPNSTDPNHKFGYNVVSEQSAMSNMVLAHELGHNLSAAHGHGEDGVPSDLDYARGHRFTANDANYRTIMAIDQNYTRIPHFSNPSVLHEGEPTGIVIGEVGEADNSSAFAIVAPKVAAFRLTQTENPVFLFHPVGATVVSGQSARLDAFVQGFPPLEIQWYAGSVGDTSSPLVSTDAPQERGGTQSFIETPDLNTSAQYWIRLTNPNADKESDTIEAVVVPPLSDPHVELVKQDIFTSGYTITNFALWQTVLVQHSYVESIDVRLSHQGTPPPVLIQFGEEGAAPLGERTVTYDEVASWGARTTINIPVQRFLAPGADYRITITPVEPGADGSNIIWAFGDGAVDTSAGIGQMIFSENHPDRAFKFTVHGQKAWTYHTWLGAEAISANTGRMSDSVAEDGLPNLTRYALGFGADDVRSIVEPVKGEILNIGGEDVLPFAFSVRRDVVDFEVIVEISSDLTIWTVLNAARIHFIETIDDTRDVYEARLPVAGEPRQFIRVHVASLAD